MYYLSIEFLLGRLLGNNLLNLGVRSVVEEGLRELRIRLEDVEECEVDAGLGNGGLGRLAACFLDSLATLNLPGHGHGIRYKHGLFDQKIVDGYQVFRPLLPRIYMIVEEINERFCRELWERYPGDWGRIEQMAIIAHGMVKMAHLAVVASHSVNGVAIGRREGEQRQTGP